MPRPVNADAEGTRRRILSSALTLFSDRGIDGASIREIARGADVSLAMVHHYFGSKDELYSACIDSMYAEMLELRDAFSAAIGDRGPTRELVETAVRTGFRFARSHQTAMRLLMRQVMEAGELDADRQSRVQIPFLAEMTEALARAVGRPAPELRLPVQSTVFLVARYAVSSERELAIVSGASGEAAVDAAEDHLVRVARSLLGALANAPKAN